MFKYLTSLAVGLLGVTLGTATYADHQECGAFQIADMNWGSATAMAYVDAFILQHGYGCDIEMVEGGTIPIFTSMNAQGKPDIAPELWANFIRKPLLTALNEGRLHIAIDRPMTGVKEGWWVPPSFVEQYPELDTIVKIIERPDLFPDSEDPTKGALIGCPSGWGCQLVTANLFRAFDMEAKGWKLVDPGSGGALTGSFIKATERGEPWLGYYWAPTAAAGKYDFRLMDWGVAWGGDENWLGCIVKPEQECANPQRTAWAKPVFYTVVTDRFKRAGGHAYEYMSRRVFPGDVMNVLLDYQEQERASGEDTALRFMQEYREIWSEWVGDGVADKLDATLQ